MTETNFVSESDFEKLLNSIPKETTHPYNEKLNPKDWAMFFTVMYGCALRILETTKLTPKDFDLDNRILTLNETKTGWKKTKEGKIRKSQRTTILPQHVELFREYLKDKEPDSLIWPITRQAVWKKFKELCSLSGLSYFWQKEERAFKQGWPYLLRSSRAKIMEKMGAELSLIMLKMRHKGQLVTFRYTAQDIHALLAWESQHYEVKQIV